jgi:transcriptional regulator with XRE-family HTH domain
MSVATIGSALAEKRRELGLEKGQAADKIGMSRTTYSSYEQDAQRPSVDVFPALTEFLKISMEELLILYGATCVAAVRPSLERLLSDRTDNGSEPPIAEALSSFDAIAPDEEEGSSDHTGAHSESEASSSEVVLELHEVTTQLDAQDLPSSGDEATPEDLEVAYLEIEDSSSEVALELQEVTTESETPEPGPSPAPDLEGVGETHQILTSLEYQEETIDQMDSSAGSDELSLGSVVFEPSPYFIRTSLSENDAKNPDPKKKKKKKKKKK